MSDVPIEEAEAVARRLPEFVDLIAGTDSKGVKLRLKDFEREPQLLYQCVKYAIGRGKWVRIEE